MGMFDSFLVEIDGREQELQSKRFDCVLGHYRRGDWVAGSLPGIRVFFEHLYLDENGKQVYGDDQEHADNKTVFIALAEGVFVEYQSHEGELDAQAILPILRQLQERWSDSARALAFMADALRRRQQRITALERRLGRVKSIIATARRLRAGETLDKRFDLLWEQNRKLAAGEDPLEVIDWALNDLDPDGWPSDDGTLADPLNEYRL